MRNNSIVGDVLTKTDIFSRFVSLKYLPRWVVLIIDVVFSSVAFFLSIWLVEVLIAPVFLDSLQLLHFSLFLFVQIIFFWIFHTYSGILRYSGYVDAVKLFFSVFSCVLTLIILNLLIGYFFKYRPYSYIALAIYGVFSFFILFLVRLSVKTIFDFFAMNGQNTIPVMIYGTKSEGVSIAKLLRNTERKKYKLVGFVSTNKDYVDKVLMGVKVYEFNKENIEKKVVKKAKAIILSAEKMAEINPKMDLDMFIDKGLKILHVPPMKVWDGDMPSIRQIKKINIEDLLNRPQINISKENIANAIENNVVMITGACGSIGREIAHQCVVYRPRMIVLLDNAETPMHELSLRMKEKYPEQSFVQYLADVRRIERLEFAMQTFHPNIVFHAAAYKHVPLMEDNPTESIQVNVMGTKNMADLSVKYNVGRFVMVSTDKAVNPTNVMGASKRIAEIYVQSLNDKISSDDSKDTKFITTRFGNVLGSNGSVIPLFNRQIKQGGPVTVTHPNIIRYFMTIPEACLLVLEAGTTGKGGEIFIFDMGEPVKIADLAKKMIHLSGLKPNIDIPIKYTGLRQGEKLYEELLNQKEITTETHHEKIMIAKVRQYDYDEVAVKIEELIKESYKCKNFIAVSLMKKIVPEFKSNNSVYEKLDIEKPD